MANDISIIVSADLGDTLIKLDLAKHAVNDLGDASLENAAKQDAATASTGLFSDAVAGLGQNMNVAIPLLGGFSAPIAALPIIAFAAVTAVNALVFAFGTLVAVVADFVAPLSLVAGLLGSLGLGFVFAAQRASQGGGGLQIFADKLATLHSMFSRTTDILAHAFLPYLLQLAGAAEKALLFIDKLAREPLAKAFHDMSTQGVQMLNQFIQGVAHVLARPIRLAFQVAFGAGPSGNEIASAVAGWWHQFSDYLFGYSQKHQIHIGRFLGPMTTSQVDGIFQPLIDWWNRHHFTRQGIQIGNQIMNGLARSGIGAKVGAFLVQIFEAAAVNAAHQMVHAIQAGWTALEHWLISEDNSMWNQVGAAIRSAWNSAMSSVKSAASSAINYVLGLLHQISAFFSQVFTLHINVPSVGSLVGGAAGAVGGALGGLNPFSSHAASGHVVVAHYHAAAGQNDLQSRAQYRQFVRQIGAELGFQQSRLAVGH